MQILRRSDQNLRNEHINMKTLSRTCGNLAFPPILDLPFTLSGPHRTILQTGKSNYIKNNALPDGNCIFATHQKAYLALTILAMAQRYFIGPFLMDLD